jgi:hypothetical protein
VRQRNEQKKKSSEDELNKKPPRHENERHENERHS